MRKRSNWANWPSITEWIHYIPPASQIPPHLGPFLYWTIAVFHSHLFSQIFVANFLFQSLRFNNSQSILPYSWSKAPQLLFGSWGRALAEKKRHKKGILYVLGCRAGFILLKWPGSWDKCSLGHACIGAAVFNSEIGKMASHILVNKHTHTHKLGHP